MTRSFRRGPALIGMLAAAAVLAAGCTTTVGGSPAPDPAPAPTEGPGSDPVAWADRVCQAVLSFAVPATSAPDFSRTADLSAVQRTISSYLDTVISGAQQGRSQLAEVGRAPDASGDEAAKRAQDALSALEEDFGGVKATVERMNPDDPSSFMSALAEVESTVSEVSPPNPFGDLASAPRLYRAAERSPQCQRLSALADAPR
ncbi:MAG TPA: hypothetical protein VKZ81_28775 [Pseudonocardia sp.]|jgi:hypothetical protein|uniref:hypothetical protein n=1 Tax=Pseudonocardia sp. TaxID=60912 RepID=UPI002B4B3B19|nr:hypothetical protein [Pseudonocardia sp.]HLU59474.1 hypothetical protein [Pseudonocardia sp.]